jgi:hypothetical protein
MLENSAQGSMTSTDKNEKLDICPVCNKKVEENDIAVACDGICQAWHHQTCAELQQGQFNALKATTKRKSKLLWLCETCEKDFILYKAGKSMQKEIEDVKTEMNRRLDKITETLIEISEKQKNEKISSSHPDISSPTYQKQHDDETNNSQLRMRKNEIKTMQNNTQTDQEDHEDKSPTSQLKNWK